MSRFLIIAACLALAAASCMPAAAAVRYWDGCTTLGQLSQNVAQLGGKWVTWSGSPDAWSIHMGVSGQHSQDNVTRSAYNTSTSQSAYAEIEFYLTGAGYWTMAATQTFTSLGVGSIGVTMLSNCSGLPSTTNAFGSPSGAWNTIGTLKATSTTIKVRFDENNATTNRWYLDQIRLTSATPGAIAYTGIADGANDVAAKGSCLSWAAGANSSFFDVYLGPSADSLTKVATVEEGTTSYDLGTLAPFQTFFWKITVRNVDVSTPGSVYSFTTVPEPGSLLALGTGLIGLLGFIRRRQA